jgi:hypothetical protein
LTPQVLGQCIERTGPSPEWSAAVLDEVKMNRLMLLTIATCVAILDDHCIEERDH